MAERGTGTRQSDEQIVAGLARAPEAFAVFYRRHAAGLLRELTARTSDARLAGDVCAETFAAALEHARAFDPARGPAARWLHAIAERELAHADRTGAARDRARRRLGLPALDPAAEDFVRALEEELVAAARFLARRGARRPALTRRRHLRPPALAAAAAALALAAVGLELLTGGDGGRAAGEGAVPAGAAFDPRGDACRREVGSELQAKVALLRDHPQPSPTLPQSARDAVREWGPRLDAVVADGARYWGRDGSVDFWAVPVVPRGLPDCAPASRVCVVAVPEGSRAVAQCALGRDRRGESWLLGPLLPRNAVMFGVVPDGVTGVQVRSGGAVAEIPAHDNVFGGVLPFAYRMSDRPRAELLHGEPVTEALVGIVDAGGPVADVVGRLRARGHKTLAAVTPGIYDQRSVVYWWPGRATLQEAGDVAVTAGIEEVAAIADTERVPRPVLETPAPFIVVVGKR